MHKEYSLRVMRIIADLHVDDIESAKGFYSDYLGLADEEFNMGWAARYTSPDTGGTHAVGHRRRDSVRGPRHFRSGR
jgi:predicted enzyme related to lactoylglutathione lyase